MVVINFPQYLFVNFTFHISHFTFHILFLKKTRDNGLNLCLTRNIFSPHSTCVWLTPSVFDPRWWWLHFVFAILFDFASSAHLLGVNVLFGRKKHRGFKVFSNLSYLYDLRFNTINTDTFENTYTYIKVQINQPNSVFGSLPV